MKLLFLPLIFLAFGCARNDVAAFWRAGGKYELRLSLTSRPALTAELAPYFNPTVDSATLILGVDSIVAATAYGKVEGDIRHFPVMFQAIGGNYFSATRDREHWTITINPDATDTGLALDGQLSHGVIDGNWVTRSDSRTKGKFHLRPIS